MSSLRAIWLATKSLTPSHCSAVFHHSTPTQLWSCWKLPPYYYTCEVISPALCFPGWFCWAPPPTSSQGHDLDRLQRARGPLAPLLTRLMPAIVLSKDFTAQSSLLRGTQWQQLLCLYAALYVLQITHLNLSCENYKGHKIYIQHWWFKQSYVFFPPMIQK